MVGSTPSESVLRFVEQINAHEADGIAALLTEEHRFVDSLGAEVVGRDAMRAGWLAYLRDVPDYRIEVRETFTAGDRVVLLGWARGTLAHDGILRPENAWATPAAWRARVDGGLIAEWQVYADNEPMRRVMANGSVNP